MSKNDLKLEAVSKIKQSRRRAIMVRFTILFLILSVVVGCSSRSEENSYPKGNQAVGENISTAKSKLLFFINPNGYPCQMQEKILSENAAEIEAYADVEYVSTTVPEDREKFYEYGIRALPILILVDKEGKVIKRFSPGIIDINEIMQYIKKGV